MSGCLKSALPATTYSACSSVRLGDVDGVLLRHLCFWMFDGPLLWLCYAYLLKEWGLIECEQREPFYVHHQTKMATDTVWQHTGALQPRGNKVPALQTGSQTYMHANMHLWSLKTQPLYSTHRSHYTLKEAKLSELPYLNHKNQT